MKRALILGALTLAGCAGQPKPEPVVRTVTVSVPTPVSCVPATLPAPKAYPDPAPSLLALPNAISRARSVESGWGKRDVRLKLLEDVVAACRAAAPPAQ